MGSTTEENKPKITVCMVTKNEEFMLPMSLNSALTFADEIVIVDDNSTDRTKDVVEKFQAETDVPIKFIQEDFGLHCSKQRECALQNATSEWIFWLDADEAVSDDFPETVHQVIKDNGEIADVFDVQYVHFVHDFAHIDASEAIHVGIVRLHRKLPTTRCYIPEHKYHTMPQDPNFKGRFLSPELIIYHCGYLLGMTKIFERYKRNVNFSQLHHPAHQMAWRDWHYHGEYPKKKFDMNNIPKVIKKHFDIGCYDLNECRSFKNNPYWKRDA